MLVRRTICRQRGDFLTIHQYHLGHAVNAHRILTHMKLELDLENYIDGYRSRLVSRPSVVAAVQLLYLAYSLPAPGPSRIRIRQTSEVRETRCMRIVTHRILYSSMVCSRLP